jgi:hypothetical protein
LLPAFAAQICSPVVITPTIRREEDRHQLVFAPPAQVKLTQKPASIPFAPLHFAPLQVKTDQKTRVKSLCAITGNSKAVTYSGVQFSKLPPTTTE